MAATLEFRPWFKEVTSDFITTSTTRIYSTGGDSAMTTSECTKSADRVINGYILDETTKDLLDRVVLNCFYKNINIDLVGSRLVKNIHPDDWDFAIDATSKEKRGTVEREILTLEEFYTTGSDPNHRDFGKDFVSYRHGLLNLIVIFDKQLYSNFMTSSRFISDAQLKLKSERVAVHDYIDGAPDRITEEDFASLASGRKAKSKQYLKYVAKYDHKGFYF